MSETLTVPGVYIEERNALAMSIHSGETAVPVFIGHFNNKDGTPYVDASCIQIASWLEFTSRFGPSDSVSITLEKNATPDTANGPYTLKESAIEKPYLGFHSVRLYFENGGGPCYILPLATRDALSLAALASKIEQYLEITLLCWCEYTEEDEDLYNALGSLQEKHYFLLTDALPNKKKTTPPQKKPLATSLLHYTFRDPTQTAVYFPLLQTSYRYHVSDALIKVKGLDATAWGRKDNKSELILSEMTEFSKKQLAEFEKKLREIQDNGDDTPEKLKQIEEAKANIKKSQENTALCAKIHQMVTAAFIAEPIYLRASCAMAGVIARTDRERGVWKAPANVALIGVEGLASIDSTNNKVSPIRIDDAINYQLVKDKINPIREFRGKGFLAWGARTAEDPIRPDWLYISVRRLFNTVERDLSQALRITAFEPNNAITWERIRSAIDIYLDGLWRKGALLGSAPQEAYFVRIGQGVTMTETDIKQGKLIVKIGMAAVRPAEFIELQFTQDMVS